MKRVTREHPMPDQDKIDEMLVRLFFADNPSWVIVTGILEELSVARMELKQYYDWAMFGESQAEVVEMSLNPPQVTVRTGDDSWEKVNEE